MFSIIIPTYNEEQFLPNLLKDIKTQSIAPHEIIVADANSTDRTREIAKKYKCSIIDGGLPSIGRNRGAAQARYGILIFFDADVRLPTKTYLEDSLKEFRRRKLDLATCDVIPSEGPALNYFMLKTYNTYTRLLERMRPHAPGFCIFIKRRIHKKIGGFDERVLLAEDHDYVQRAALYGSFGVLRIAPIVTSTRRFVKDGHLKTISKYILCELHMSTFGSVKHDLFKYRFGYKK